MNTFILNIFLNTFVISFEIDQHLNIHLPICQVKYDSNEKTNNCYVTTKFGKYIQNDVGIGRMGTLKFIKLR